MRSAAQVFWLFFILSQSAWAAVTITAVDGASKYSITSGVTPQIYGGVGGVSGTGADCTSVDGLTPCNGCATATTGLFVCNRQRIDPNLRLRISFKSDAADGRPILVKDSTLVDVEATTVTRGNTATVDVIWNNICAQLSPAATGCTGSANSTAAFRVGIDANSNNTLDSGEDSTQVNITILDPDPTGVGDAHTIDDCATNTSPGPDYPGVCGFTAYPGDEKIYLDDAEAGTGFPTTASGTLSTIQVYAKEGSYITAPSEMTPKELQITQSATGYDIVDKVVDGLTNGTSVFVRVSVADAAGNEMYFTSDTAITNLCGSLAPVPPFDGTGGGTFCPYAAVPDEVLGLLTDDVNCFIATAAYGSAFHPLVKDFRQFRDQFLKPFAWGQKFIDWYYQWSPPKASWLKKNPVARNFAGLLLLPIWVLTRLIVWWPITLFFGFLIWASFQGERSRRLKRD